MGEEGTTGPQDGTGQAVAGYRRYAIYVVPDGAFHAAGAAWLGWDIAAGRAVPHPEVAGLPDPVEALTATPRKYGFHGTIKPPFRLTRGTDAVGLGAALTAFCAARPAVRVPRIALRRQGRFLALVPEAPVAPLNDLAAAAVAAFEPFRAPLTEAELARRRKSRLTARQEGLLQRWGYPYVMEEFRFHMTLTGALDTASLEAAGDALGSHFAPFIGRPFDIDTLALAGEAEDGMFHLLHRYALTG